MKKIKEIIKTKDIDIMLVLIIALSYLTFFIVLNSYDELWNFANAYKMFNEYKIYEELNVIITPLFFYIAQIFFFVFGETILSFRIYNVLIFFYLFILIYYIFKNLNIVRRRSMFYTILMLFAFSSIISGGANYNILALIPILVNILLILKQKENDIITGILLFITFLSKQNVLLYYVIGVFVYKFITIQNKKQFITDIIKIYFITFICIAIFLIYMYLDNNLYNFINYCFLGIIEFGTKNLAINFFAIGYIYIGIAVIIFILIIINNKKIKKNIKNDVIYNVKILLSFGAPLLFIAYPIANYYHSTIASLIIIMTFIYIIEKTLIEELEINSKKEKKLYIILIILFLVYYSYFNMGIIKIDSIKFITQGVYTGTIAFEEDIEDIEIICDYIQQNEKDGKNVIVLSYKANLYNVNINKNNGVFDLCFLGNLGKEGEKGIIEKINNLENTIILTEKKARGIEQEATNVINYIINNYKKIGEIQEYCVYEIK